MCAADVDLANSEALKASRKYDPKVERTIGVITKMDLVDASYAASLVVNEDYPLQLGYIGVVCKGLDGSEGSGSTHESSQKSLISRITGKLMREEDPRLQFERQYFEQNQEAYNHVKDRLGLIALRHLLTASLEEIMSKSLDSVVKNVSDDLEELKYQLKAQYNDRFVSPEAYVSDLISSLKKDFAHLSRQVTRHQIDATLRGTFNQKLIQICDEFLWNSSEANQDKTKKLNTCLNSFTRSGVGKFTANLVSDAILNEIEGILTKPPFTFHSQLKDKISSAAETFLKKKCSAAMEQVENSMKPYKQGIEFTPRDWKEARNKLLTLLDNEENRIKQDINFTKQEIGVKRLKKAVEHLQQNSDSVEKNPVLMKVQGIVYKSALLKRLQDRKKVLKKESRGDLESVKDYRHRTALWTRISTIFRNSAQNGNDRVPNELVYEPSSTSSSPSDLTIFKDPCQAEFPEIYLYLVMDRFLRTCSTFVHYELVSEFLQPFPDAVISADALEGQGGILSLTKMTPDQLRNLIKENPDIAAHLSMQERYRALEEALRNLKEMKQRNVNVK